MGRGGYLEELEQQAGTFGVEGVVGDAQCGLGRQAGATGDGS
jgi:hypothetical protein